MAVTHLSTKFGANICIQLLLLLLLLNEYYLHAVKQKKLQEHVTNMKQKR